MELIQQSRGALHVFLPLLDRGLDGVIHKLTDGQYIPVQVKSRSRVVGRSLELWIPASRLIDDRALIIAGLLADDLGPVMLVVEEGIFKQRAARYVYRGEDVYSAAVNLDMATSRWRQHLVPRDKLAERLMGSLLRSSWLPPHDLGVQPIDRHKQWLGFVGEAEVVRMLADNPELDLFRPFPDLEMVEVLARDNVSGRYCGLQVKAGVPSKHGEAYIQIRKATFVPALSTFVVALAWLPQPRRFADECLLIPSDDLIGVSDDDAKHWVVCFHPHSPKRTRLDPYRHPLADLGELVGKVTSS
jgi:hypothetical protein